MRSAGWAATSAASTAAPWPIGYKELERLVRTLEHTVVTVVAEADRRQVWAEDGHRSVRGWCMATTN